MRISDWRSDVCSSVLVRSLSGVAVIDARGLRCPWPALRLARAVRQAGGGCFELLAEDPAAAHDNHRLAEEPGWKIEQLPADPPLLKWRINACSQPLVYCFRLGSLGVRERGGRPDEH